MNERLPMNSETVEPPATRRPLEPIVRRSLSDRRCGSSAAEQGTHNSGVSGSSPLRTIGSERVVVNVRIEQHVLDRFRERTGVAGEEAIGLIRAIVRLKAPATPCKRWRVSDGRLVFCGKTQRDGTIRVVTMFTTGRLRV